MMPVTHGSRGPPGPRLSSVERDPADVLRSNRKVSGAAVPPPSDLGVSHSGTAGSSRSSIPPASGTPHDRGRSRFRPAGWSLEGNLPSFVQGSAPQAPASTYVSTAGVAEVALPGTQDRGRSRSRQASRSLAGTLAGSVPMSAGVASSEEPSSKAQSSQSPPLPRASPPPQIVTAPPKIKASEDRGSSYDAQIEGKGATSDLSGVQS